MSQPTILHMSDEGAEKRLQTLLGGVATIIVVHDMRALKDILREQLAEIVRDNGGQVPGEETRRRL
jgi:hypothetical protein